MSSLLFLFSLSSAEAKPKIFFNRQTNTPKTITIDFEDFEVNAEVTKPSIDLVEEFKRAQFNPMLKLRLDFNPELSESVSQIK